MVLGSRFGFERPQILPGSIQASLHRVYNTTYTYVHTWVDVVPT